MLAPAFAVHTRRVESGRQESGSRWVRGIVTAIEPRSNRNRYRKGGGRTVTDLGGRMLRRTFIAACLLAAAVTGAAAQDKTAKAVFAGGWFWCVGGDFDQG